jgi:NADPH2:quinone reductase
MKIKAMVATRLGGPEVLQPRDIHLDWPRGDRDVLVELTAAAINPADIFFRQLGGYVTSDAPFVLGHDGAGIVTAVGNKVTAFEPGARVCFCSGGIGGEPGTYAQAAVVPEWQLAGIPQGIDDLTAAALPLVGITAWEAINERAQAAADEFVLVHGGAGGTGHVAVQLARLAGAKVAATVSSAHKAKIAEGLGAERTINYREDDFVDAAVAWSGSGIDVAFDNVGAEVMQKTFRAMAPYGRIVTLMGTTGDTPDQDAYNRNLTIHNVMMLTPMWKQLTERLRHQADIVRNVLELVASHKLTILHAATFPLSKVAEAHALMESGRAVGKITLQIRDEL